MSSVGNSSDHQILHSSGGLSYSQVDLMLHFFLMLKCGVEEARNGT
jgi:hypothetical protein